MFEKLFYCQARRQMACLYIHYHNGQDIDFSKFERILSRSARKGLFSDVAKLARMRLRNMPCQESVDLLERIANSAPHLVRDVVADLGHMRTESSLDAMERLVEKFPYPAIEREKKRILDQLDAISKMPTDERGPSPMQLKKAGPKSPAL